MRRRLDVEKNLREQGIITKKNTVKDDIFIWGCKRIRIYTHPREYKYMESDDDQIAHFVTLENTDSWQKQVLEVLEQCSDD